MRNTTERIILWAPRIVGIGLAAFLALFSLDSLANPSGILETTIAVVMGLLPALVVLISVAVAWNRPAIGAGIFSALAMLYGASALDHPAWIVLISGPLVLEAGLFVLSWWFRAKRP